MSKTRTSRPAASTETERISRPRRAYLARFRIAAWLACCALPLEGSSQGPSRLARPEAGDHAAERPDREPTPLVEGRAGLSALDYAGIRQAYEAGRHAAYPVDGGYRARNPGQSWSTRFDDRGFTVAPDAGGWSWGLELEAFGCAGREVPVTTSACMNADGGRVARAWSDTLEEWYVNDGRGLEHGFTVHGRPPSDADGEDPPLSLTLAVRGPLRPAVAADGRSVRFLDGDGAAIVTYAELVAFDATGRELPASFVRRGDRLRLLVDGDGARYPLTIDPIAQQAYLKAGNSEAGDFFGMAVATSGDTVVVTATGESSNATGVNGDPSNNGAPGSGAAYVFVRNGTSWSQQAYLKASNTDANDRFGGSVSMSGDTIVVGASAEDSEATGVNGNQGNNSNSLFDAGAAYVFVRSGTSWSQQAYLKASNTGRNDAFGGSVAVSGNTVVVGAQFEASSATGVNGNQADDSASGAGAAYVFVRNGASWSQEAYLKASNTAYFDLFGGSVAVSGDTVVVGAPLEDSNATGVGGNQSSNTAQMAGAAYVFARNGSTWSQQAYLKASNTDGGDGFGLAVALSGDTAVVGAYMEDSGATGVDGDQGNSQSSIDSGAAYVFVRSGTSWSQQAYLKASNTDEGDEFGVDVALSGDTAVIGAYMEDSGATGVDGDQGNSQSSIDSGAAYAFVRSPLGWSQQAYLKASNTDAGDSFGASVAISGVSAVVGAWREDSDVNGVNGGPDNELAPDAGSAYVFRLCGPQASSEAVRLGVPPNPNAFLPGVTSGPIIGATWDPVIDHTLFAPGALIDFAAVDLGPPINAPLALGTLLCTPPPANQVFVAAPSAPFGIPVPDECALVGRAACSQAGSVSPGPAIELTNALDLVIGSD